MAFTSQLPGSPSFTRFEYNEQEMPSAGGTAQMSCYSFVEKISGITNPIGLQHDVMYANSFAAIMERDINNVSESETPLAAGCVGHQPDKEFPLESKTPFPMPLIMYPTKTNGTTLDCADMCAKPVLNWEAYIQDLKSSTIKAARSKISTSNGNSEGASEDDQVLAKNMVLDTIPEEMVEVVLEEDVDDDSTPANERALQIYSGKPQSHIHSLPESSSRARGNNQKTLAGRKSLAITNQCGNKKFKMTRGRGRLKLGQKKPKEPGIVTEHLNDEVDQADNCKGEKLSRIYWKRIKNQPKLRVEATWNHLYGGYNGACCFLKDASTNTLNLYVSKGSKLRAVQLTPSKPSSIYSHSVESVWDESPDPSSSTALGNDPFDELTFQIVSSESSKLLGVRRGRSVSIYDTEQSVPILLETIRSSSYKDYVSTNNNEVPNPIFRGLDFNPTFAPEIITIDENMVIRVCNFSKGAIPDQFCLPNVRKYSVTPKEYPEFAINDAIGVTFANFGQLFYAWGNSIVYLGDRRSRKYSRDHIMPLFDLRNDVHSLAISNQNHFHDKTTTLTEYMSCVRRSKNENYYYVGTSNRIYLMDVRVPSHPVIMVSHGLQSPPAYMDICSDDGENFEMIVAASQRTSETVCIISDTVHLECTSRHGCKSRNPLLYCYPRHLLNPRKYFDDVVKDGYSFSFPTDNDLVKEHCYAWPTGVAAYPLCSKSSPALPGGILIVSSNNFGDIFWQEWDQKPLPSHKRSNISDYKIKKFLSDWHTAMRSKDVMCDVTKTLKNPKKSVDCTILLEPIAKEIERLSRVRYSSFNVLQPDQVHNQTSVRSMMSMNALFAKLEKYKSPQVKGFLDVWRKGREKATESIEVESSHIVEIKIEPEVLDEDLSSGSSVELIDNDTDQDQLEFSNIESEIRNTLNFNTNEDRNPLSQNEPWTISAYSRVFEGNQPFDPSIDDDDDDILNVPLIQPASSKGILKTNKLRKSGFL